MATSRPPGPLCSADQWPAAATPGPLGLNDHGDPDVCTRVGDTPGPLGFFDLADAELPPLLAQSGFVANPARTKDGTALTAGWLSVSDRLATSSKITSAQLKLLFELAPSDLLAKVADELNRKPEVYQLDTKLRRAHFFAQVREETGPSMDAKTEDLTYSPAALKGLFAYYGKHPDEADTDGYERGPKGTFKRKAIQEDIANKAYGGRNGNGNEKSGDGWKYRGRGFIQVTGRSNYAAVSAKHASVFGDASVNFERDPDLLTVFPYSLRSAICYWLINGLYRLADKGSSAGDVDRVTRVVNANTHSYKERQHHFKTAYEHFE